MVMSLGRRWHYTPSALPDLESSSYHVLGVLKYCLILCHSRPGIMLWISKIILREKGGKKTLLLFLYSYLSWLLIISIICIVYSSLGNIFIYIIVSGIKRKFITHNWIIEKSELSRAQIQTGLIFFSNHHLQRWDQMFLPYPSRTPLVNSILFWLFCWSKNAPTCLYPQSHIQINAHPIPFPQGWPVSGLSDLSWG